MRRIEKLNSDEFFNIYVKSKSNLLKLENSNESVMILFREGIKVEINGIFHSRGGSQVIFHALKIMIIKKFSHKIVIILI